MNYKTFLLSLSVSTSLSPLYAMDMVEIKIERDETHSTALTQPSRKYVRHEIIDRREIEEKLPMINRGDYDLNCLGCAFSFHKWVHK